MKTPSTAVTRPHLKEISKRLIQSAKQGGILVIIGAGLSAPSGIPTFRKGGQVAPTWKTLPALSHEDWQSNPQQIWDFIQRRIATGETQPRPVAHLPLAGILTQLHTLGHKEGGVVVITQNIDLLLEEAFTQLGTPAERRPEIFHVHGLLGWRCSNCGASGELSKEGKPPTRCQACFAGHEQWKKQDKGKSCTPGLRPDVVLFGEELPEEFGEIWDQASAKDSALVIGSSLEVTPVGLLPGRVNSTGGKIIIIDEVLPERLKALPDKEALWIRGDLQETLRELERSIDEEIQGKNQTKEKT